MEEGRCVREAVDDCRRCVAEESHETTAECREKVDKNRRGDKRLPTRRRQDKTDYVSKWLQVCAALCVCVCVCVSEGGRRPIDDGFR